MKKSNTQCGFLISQVKRVSGRFFEKILADSNIDAFNGAQGRILYVLWQKDPLPMIEISQKTGLAKTTLTSMIARMEDVNLVEKRYNDNDHRQVLIALTDKARELNDEYNRVSQQMEDIYYKKFKEEEKEQFESFLLRILDNLKGEEINE